MTKRTKAGTVRKKTQRFESLKKRRRQHAQLFDAIERREQRETTRLASVRAQLRSASTVRRATIERRREEYIAIPPPRAPVFSARMVAAVAGAFVFPFLLALVSNMFTQRVPMHAQRVVTLSRHASTFVANQASRNGSNRSHLPADSHSTSTRPASATVRPSVAILQTRPPRPIAQATRPIAPSPQAVQRAQPVVQRVTRSAQRVVRAAVASASRPVTARATKPNAVQMFAMVMRAVFGAPATQPRPVTLRHEMPKPEARNRLALAPIHPQEPTSRPQLRRSSPWVLGADGTWSAIVRAPDGTRYPSFAADTGQVIALERSPIRSDGAIVTIGWARPVNVTISSPDQTTTRTLAAPDDSLDAFDAVARPVGPHLINIGWTPLGGEAQVSDYKIFRSTGEGERPELINTVPSSQHSLRDSNVDASSRYRYTVVAETTNASVQASSQTIDTSAELPSATASDISGKGMFLYFSALPGDARNFHRYNPEHVIAEAQRAGIRVIELRMARGSCTMAETSEAHAWLNRLIDSAAQSDIKMLAWTVPRRVTTQDLAETIGAAQYTTPSGNGFIGLALDLETGDKYMGDGATARHSMVEYIAAVRNAVGPHYLIVATLASPQMGGSSYPYARIADYANVLQPMEYWHYFDEVAQHEYSRGEVAGAAEAAVARTRALAGRDIPVDIAGQSVDLEGTGAPSGREIRWSLDGAKSVGAIGETFFDWAGTQPDGWAAIQAFDW